MDAAAERKKRIEELKRKKEELLSQGKVSSTENSATSTVRFRNYIPKDDGLKEKMDNVVVDEKPLDYESDLKASSAMPGRNDEINLAPKKPNWDLKRGIEHKMEMLEKETQKAMIQMLKEKIEAEESDSDEE
ncbi:pre-mRNA splicing factor protein [Blastocystis sp. subtype 4]|uniref:pre-mRNA splicing factor protein n=1 Tax=Blastocystis sp. subtype 4 TaxID=944170 RepID=UPI000712213D|nr:pre-mRNA splicing factor protein [Blastocystis sp. subtype 4]KNB46726.1 pre-mRNA splicing factor protein [Blastocystis sp. subtype 4]|eukprot:XP_014530169.1 pre-mRNA splicing factor protein [Blastocystis sp. subtype 4]